MLIIFVDTNKAIARDEKIKPTDTIDGIYNRFGFIVKKPEAVMKKQLFFQKKGTLDLL